ncbi:nuclear transport factor 2 family protein [Colwellia sp. RE-S-Sl-9]
MKVTQNAENDFMNIMALIQCYFDGLYYGDVDKLTSIFHNDAWLKSPGLRLSKKEWLANVATRPIPADLKAEFAFKLLSIDVIHDQASVKVECPLFDYHYIDFLGLLKENGNWLIVNKMFTDISDKH